jgi:hypothetical protein
MITNVARANTKVLERTRDVSEGSGERVGAVRLGRPEPIAGGALSSQGPD